MKPFEYVEAAAPVIGLEFHVLQASTVNEIDAAFANIARDRTDALFVTPDGFFTAGESGWRFWRRAAQFLRPTGSAAMPPPAG